MESASYFDLITALPTRRAFDKVLGDAALRPAGRPFAVAILDLDGFRSLNERHGRAGGDALLVTAGLRLREALRDGDFVARVGGDRFAMTLLGAGRPPQAEAVCERMALLLAKPISFQSGDAYLAASIGLAMFPAHGSDGETLYGRAEAALKATKKAGRGRWCWAN